ncbi:MAG: N(2)-fixation sustaining protein CowN [Rhodospirillales bacterium]|nr:N(2)-fixation sustaining protein CowN [Rhodospirillales bacterium]
MTCGQNAQQGLRRVSEHTDTDRYKTFEGIDCVGNSLRLVAAIRSHIDDPTKTNAFWEVFKVKLAEAADQERHAPDELRLICSYVYLIEELFERYGDAAGLALLRQIEEECC